jgi:peptidoglycan hydrolase-like protein with peptidoglycan-binding domain
MKYWNRCHLLFVAILIFGGMQFFTYARASSGIQSESDWDVCFEAVDLRYNYNQGLANNRRSQELYAASWNRNHAYVNEARRRNLTPDKCRQINELKRRATVRPLPVLRSAYGRRNVGEGQCWEGPTRPIVWMTARRCENAGGLLMRNSGDLNLCQKNRLAPRECLRLLQEIDAQSQALSSDARTAKSVPAPPEGPSTDADAIKSSLAFRSRETLIVRKFPSYEAHEIAHLNSGQSFVVERKTADGWSFIKFSKGRYGYVRSSSIPPAISLRAAEALRAKNQGHTGKDLLAKKGDSQERHGEIEAKRQRLIQLQTALHTLGLYDGKVDGVSGPKTRAAVNRWLKANGLATGVELTDDLVADIERQVVAQSSSRLAKANATRQRRQSEQDKALSALRKAHKHSIAVIIGNRDYTGRTPDVAFAGNDADAIRSFVIGDLGYREGNIIDLRDTSLTQLNATFGTAGNHKGRLFDYVRAGKSDVIVFYSGHGVPGLRDRKGYLLPVNADPNRAELNGYPLDTLLANLAKVPARSMAVYIDACFSGESQKGLLVRATSGITVQAKVPKSSKRMIVVTAAQGDQFASWDEDAKHGLFTKHLLEALRGRADGEGYGNGDGKVTLNELRAYLDEEMTYQARRRWSRDQNASIQGASGAVLSTLH